MRERLRRWLGISCLEWHLHNEVEHDLELYKQKLKFIEEDRGSLQIDAFGYAEPDTYCPDWNGDMHLKNVLGYSSLGCMCCDNLVSPQRPPLRNKKIILECSKGHTLVVGVLKEDPQE